MRNFLAHAVVVAVAPDPVSRMGKDSPLNTPDMATSYLPGPKGYTDYPAMAACSRGLTMNARPLWNCVR